MTITIEHKGSLSKYGYHADKSDMARHRALNVAVKTVGYDTTMRKVNAIAVLNKNNKYGEIYESDKKYLKDKFKK